MSFTFPIYASVDTKDIKETSDDKQTIDEYNNIINQFCNYLADHAEDIKHVETQQPKAQQPVKQEDPKFDITIKTDDKTDIYKTEIKRVSAKLMRLKHENKNLKNKMMKIRDEYWKVKDRVKELEQDQEEEYEDVEENKGCKYYNYFMALLVMVFYSGLFYYNTIYNKTA